MEVQILDHTGIIFMQLQLFRLDLRLKVPLAEVDKELQIHWFHHYFRDKIFQVLKW